MQMYCGKKSEMGRVIARLRLKYQTARAEAVPQVEEVTGEGVTELACAAPSESDSTEAVETKGRCLDWLYSVVQLGVLLSFFYCPFCLSHHFIFFVYD